MDQPQVNLGKIIDWFSAINIWLIYFILSLLQVKAIHGLGTAIDVILVNGKIHEGDTIVVAGTEGPIVTQIRAVLMPQPMKELRVKVGVQIVEHCS